MAEKCLILAGCAFSFRSLWKMDKCIQIWAEMGKDSFFDGSSPIRNPSFCRIRVFMEGDLVSSSTRASDTRNDSVVGDSACVADVHPSQSLSNAVDLT